MKTSRINHYMSLLFFFMIFRGGGLRANNILVSNVQLTGQNTISHYTLVQFDLSWDNSWRVSVGPSNWDAAWVFVKYRVKTFNSWNHATLNWVDGTGTGDGHTVPVNAAIASGDDTGAGGAYGVFIYRSADMSQGSVSYTGAQLRWNYGADGLSDADSVEVAVYAIEMVYVPQGSFYVGSGGTETGAIYEYPNTTTPYQVTSENAITVGTTAGNLYYISGGDHNGPIPAAFPKGFNAFYCMKYEITQGEYVAFLNTLTTTQASSRNTTYSAFRYAITGSAPGGYSTTTPDIACNYINWGDFSAFLDWAALRPMTEMEFEKACRGPNIPTPGAFAWGSTSVYASAYTLSNPGLSSEGVANFSTSTGNANYFSTSSSISGPARVGIFSANAATTGRETSGASYYGIMELSGNVHERCVTIGLAIGRSFTGLHGDGEITNTGTHDVTGWSSSGSGIGWWGGSWRYASALMRVSDRSFYSVGDSRYDYLGGRGIRTAP